MLQSGSPDPRILQHIWSVIGRAAGRRCGGFWRPVGVSPPSILFDKLYEGRTLQPSVVAAPENCWELLHRVDLSFVMNTNIQRCLADAAREHGRKEEAAVIEILVKLQEVIWTNPCRTERMASVCFCELPHIIFSPAHDWRATCVISTWNICLAGSRWPLKLSTTKTSTRSGPEPNRDPSACCTQEIDQMRGNSLLPKPTSGTVQNNRPWRKEHSLSYHNIFIHLCFLSQDESHFYDGLTI